MTQARDLGNVGDTLAGVSNVNIDSGTLFVDATNNFVGIGTTAPSKKFVVTDNNNLGFEVSPNDAAQSYNRLINYNRTTNQYVPVRYEGSTHGWYANTNGAVNAMNINAAGLVTKPNQPYLRATTNVANYNFNPTATNIIPFNNITVQVGSNYNTSTYRYTAPVAGAYYVMASIQGSLMASTTYYNLFLRVNGGGWAGTYITGRNVSYEAIQTSGIINVSAGDYFDVAIYVNSTGGIESGPGDTRNLFIVYYLG